MSSAAPPPGGYVTEGGWGHLNVGAGAAPTFRIETTGVNGHSCRVEGTVTGALGTTAPVLADGTACTVRFNVRPGAVEVTPLEHEACRAECGARAGFDGTYVVPAAGCGDAERRRAEDDSLSEYRAGRFQRAADPLAALLSHCARTLGAVEDAQLRNDLAVALFHLGRRADCRAVLAPLHGSAADADLALLHNVAPTDFDTWSAVARTTNHNLALCAEATP